MVGASPQSVLDALAARSDGAAALSLRGARIAVVGGFVRDVLLGREPREVDLVVEGDVRAVAEQLGGVVTPHPAFLACHVTGKGWTIELTTARREHYPRPGALPVVEPARIEDDLGRRDFGANAIAVTLETGELLEARGALDDLSSRRLRVLHARSFDDDPTRVMRLARYRARLHFEVEPWTAGLAAGARLETVSGSRIGAELRLILREQDPLAVLGDLRAQLPLTVEPDLVACALELIQPDADRELLILAAVVRDAPAPWLDSIELTAHERAVVADAERAPALAMAVAAADSPSALRDVLRGVAPEAAAIAGALGPLAAVRRWLEDVRHVRLEISGGDLLAAGIPAGPELGARLERTLRLKLDGRLSGGREAELQSALGGPG